MENMENIPESKNKPHFLVLPESRKSKQTKDLYQSSNENPKDLYQALF